MTSMHIIGTLAYLSFRREVVKPSACKAYKRMSIKDRVTRNNKFLEMPWRATRALVLQILLEISKNIWSAPSAANFQTFIAQKKLASS